MRMTKEEKENILTSLFWNYGLREHINICIDSMPERCRISGHEKGGNFVMEIEFPADWVADFNE